MPWRDGGRRTDSERSAEEVEDGLYGSDYMECGTRRLHHRNERHGHRDADVDARIIWREPRVRVHATAVSCVRAARNSR